MPPPTFEDHTRLEHFLTSLHLWLLEPRGLGVSRAAEEVGCSPGHLCNLLTGRRPLLARHVTPLARAVSLDHRSAERLLARVRGGAAAEPPVILGVADPLAAAALLEGRRRLREAPSGTWAARAWVWTLGAPRARAVFAAGAAALTQDTPVQSNRCVEVLLWLVPVADLRAGAVVPVTIPAEPALLQQDGGATVSEMLLELPELNLSLDVLDHLDYRDWINRWYESRKARKPRLSFRWLGHRFGVTPGHIRNVLNRVRDLDPDTVRVAAERMGLDADRARYLRSLIEYNDADEPLVALTALRELNQLRARHGRPLDREATSPLLLRWYLGVILALSTRPEWREDPGWIAAALRPPITPAQAEDALCVLRAGGYLPGGPLGRASVVKAPDRLAEAAVARLHDECFDVAAQVSALGLEPWEHRRVLIPVDAADRLAIERAASRWHEAVEGAALQPDAEPQTHAFLFFAQVYGPGPAPPP